MLPLIVRVSNTQTGGAEHSAFASSPVRIGRNQLNELVINEPFVSQWHAVVRFDAHKVRYVDLGSTNGTLMNGRRLAKHLQVEIAPESDLRIGPLSLSFVRSPVTPDMYASPKTSMFSATGETSPGMRPGAQGPGFESGTMFLSARPAGGGVSPVADTGVGADPRNLDLDELTQIARASKGLHDAYRQAWAHLLRTLVQHIEHVPVVRRDMTVLALCQQYPQLAREPEFRQAMTRLGVTPGAFGEVDTEGWIQRLGGRGAPPGTQINTALAMERVGAILESFGQAFVELRKGYEQFGEEMALGLVQERNPLHDAEHAQDVLRYLLDWNTDGGDRVRELTRAFADLALHQVALLSGVVEGVRGVLSSVGPEAVSGVPNAALARQGGGGFLESIFNFRKAELWRRYADAHRALLEEDRFARQVFGRDFARAYFMVTGGHLRGDEPTGR